MIALRLDRKDHQGLEEDPRAIEIPAIIRETTARRRPASFDFRTAAEGVAAAAVAAALDEIRRAGGGIVEAYPEQTEQRPPQRGAYLHTGPEELYARYGFTRVRKIAKWRWVMRTKV